MFRQRMPNFPSQVLSVFKFDCVYLVNNVKVGPAETHTFSCFMSHEKFKSLLNLKASVSHCCYCWRLMLVWLSAQRLIFCSYLRQWNMVVFCRRGGVACCLGNEQQLKPTNQSVNRIWILWSIWGKRYIKVIWIHR